MTEMIEVTLPSNNPWLRGPKATYPRAEAERLAQLACDACEAVRHLELKNAYNYDKYVWSALNEFLPEGQTAKNTCLFAVQAVLRELGGYGHSDWYHPAYCAMRVIRTRNAYATPGFIEARNASSFANGG